MLSTRMFQRMRRLFVAVLLCALTPVGAIAQQSNLGKVDFPTTGSDEAKAHFLRGVAALQAMRKDDDR